MRAIVHFNLTLFKADPQMSFLVRFHCITSVFFKQIKETVPSPVTFLYEVAIDIKTQVSIVRCYCLLIDFVFSMPRNSGYKNCNKILEYIILTFLSVSACSLIIISRKCTCWLLFINIYI